MHESLHDGSRHRYDHTHKPGFLSCTALVFHCISEGAKNKIEGVLSVPPPVARRASHGATDIREPPDVIKISDVKVVRDPFRDLVDYSRMREYARNRHEWGSLFDEGSVMSMPSLKRSMGVAVDLSTPKMLPRLLSAVVTANRSPRIACTGSGPIQSNALTQRIALTLNTTHLIVAVALAKYV